MKKQIVIFLAYCIASLGQAAEGRSLEGATLAWMSQTARLQAQKTCLRLNADSRPLCEAQQLKSLAETAASLHAFRPAHLSPREFATLIEQHAKNTYLFDADRPTDCRIDVC
jgi:hypothetical protein